MTHEHQIQPANHPAQHLRAARHDLLRAEEWSRAVDVGDESVRADNLGRLAACALGHVRDALDGVRGVQP